MVLSTASLHETQLSPRSIFSIHWTGGQETQKLSKLQVVEHTNATAAPPAAVSTQHWALRSLGLAGIQLVSRGVNIEDNLPHPC
jgi:hypothetical protein